MRNTPEIYSQGPYTSQNRLSACEGPCDACLTVVSFSPDEGGFATLGRAAAEQLPQLREQRIILAHG